MTGHELTKSVWTDADFDVMGWHDAHLHCFSVLPESWELVMDLDYIAKWVHPEEGETYFRFWVSPVTLVFADLQHLDVRIQMDALCEIDVLDLHREPGERDGDWRWSVELGPGEISFNSTGFKQFFRKEPMLVDRQMLTHAERGGLSYARTAWDGST